MGREGPVGAAGDQSHRSGNNYISAPVGLPASAPGILAVGALAGEAPSILRSADFSNVGVDVSAPGVGILSARSGGGLVRRSGTGTAAAHVAGVAALWAEKLISNSGGPIEMDMLRSHLLGRATQAHLNVPFDQQAVGQGVVQAP